MEITNTPENGLFNFSYEFLRQAHDIYRQYDMEAQLPIAYGTALVLILIILLVNLLANALRKYFEKKIKTN